MFFVCLVVSFCFCFLFLLIHCFLFPILDSSNKMQIHPKHAKEWIKNEVLNKLLGVVNPLMMIHGGNVFVQRCWNALLYKPHLKPPFRTICDVLLCSPTFPLVLVTLVNSNVDKTQEVATYNTALARTLKRVLTQEAGCVEEFLVKPVVISNEDLSLESFGKQIFAVPSCYHDKYSMTQEKYSKILEALAIVLTKLTTSFLIEAGLKHFSVLTKEQYDILDEFYGSTSKVKITGLPGTGKTWLALERIERLRIGSCVKWFEILYVCSNKCLEASVRYVQQNTHLYYIYYAVSVYSESSCVK